MTGALGSAMAPTCPVEGIEGIEGTTSNKAHDSSTQQSVTSQSFSSFLPTSFMVESMSVTTAASDEDIPSFIRSFVHSFIHSIQFNSIQFNLIQFNSIHSYIHTYVLHPHHEDVKAFNLREATSSSKQSFEIIESATMNTCF